MRPSRDLILSNPLPISSGRGSRFGGVRPPDRARWRLIPPKLTLSDQGAKPGARRPASSDAAFRPRSFLTASLIALRASHMPKGKRPLSPHLQVYRPQLTSILSIFHRITGVALFAGLALLVYWLLAAGAGPGPFAVAQGLLGSWLGMVVLPGFSFALFFHLCNGCRRLVRDAGRGVELTAVLASGWGGGVVSTQVRGGLRRGKHVERQPPKGKWNGTPMRS